MATAPSRIQGGLRKRLHTTNWPGGAAYRGLRHDTLRHHPHPFNPEGPFGWDPVALALLHPPRGSDILTYLRSVCVPHHPILLGKPPTAGAWLSFAFSILQNAPHKKSIITRPYPSHDGHPFQRFFLPGKIHPIKNRGNAYSPQTSDGISPSELAWGTGFSTSRWWKRVAPDLWTPTSCWCASGQGKNPLHSVGHIDHYVL